MANYSQLKADIASVVKTNGAQEITGANLQQVLVQMINNSVGTGYLYKGIATPETQGGTPDQNVFYLAGAGAYANFGTTIPEGSLGVFAYNGTWLIETIEIVGGGLSNAVLYTPQTLSDAQKTQARANIDAANVIAEEVLDITVTQQAVTHEITPVQNVGYLATNGSIVNSEETFYRYSDPISLKAGDTLYIKAGTQDNVERLVKCTSDTTFTEILRGTMTSTQVNNGESYETTYIATEDFDARIGWNWPGDIEIKITRQEEVVTSKLDEIDDIKEDVENISEILGYSTTTKTEPIALVENSGYFTGSPFYVRVNANAQYRNSDFFQLEAGDVLNVELRAAPSVDVLVRKDGEKIRGLLKGTDAVQQITYNVTRSGEYAVSWLASQGITITKTSPSVTAERLDDIEDTANDASTKATTANDAIFVNIDDPLTEDIIDGKGVKKDGTVYSNSGWASKEFAVQNGAKVVATVYTHPNICVLAKKLTATTYKPLVLATTGYGVETHEYVTTEDMTLVVTWDKSYTHTITIETNNIESNRANIESILEYDTKQADELTIQDIDFGFMFDNIAVIGDSLASGRVEGIVGQPDAVGADYYNFSWIAFLSKRWRCESFKNYSNAGATTASWITQWLPVMQADTQVYDAYFIALGTNNEYNESNPSGDQENYEAFVQRYNSIIDDVRAKAPNAAIFLVSLYEKRAGNTTLEQIAETRMATDKGVYYIDYANKAKYFRYSPEVNWRGHFSSTGYVYVASAINQIVNDIVWENKTEQFWQQFAKYHN